MQLDHPHITELGYALVALATGATFYTYLAYPLILWVLAAVRRNRSNRPIRKPVLPDAEWPSISITVPMFNEEAQAAELIESLLALDYPLDRRQIVVVSDASTDRTDEIVRAYGNRGVELIRCSERVGKTEAENRAAKYLTGDIVVNTDASIRICPKALKHLVIQFRNPTVGLASGRDLSFSRAHRSVNPGEGTYVGYEMMVRKLETEVASIVGASGCLYAIRSGLHRLQVPSSMSRDFAAALWCEELGYRALSVPEATCLVPRTASLRREYRRKVRTMTQGMTTLIRKRELLNPIRHGLFSWVLFSHKVCRWALPWIGLAGLVGLVLSARGAPWAAALLALTVGAITLGGFGWFLGDARRLPRLLAVPAYLLIGNVAAMHAGLQTIRGKRTPLWEPTRRKAPPLAETRGS